MEEAVYWSDCPFSLYLFDPGASQGMLLRLNRRQEVAALHRSTRGHRLSGRPVKMYCVIEGNSDRGP